MIGALLALALAQQPQLKLAVLEVKATGTSADGAFLTSHLSTQLGAAGCSAISPQQIAAVLGLERHKDLGGRQQRPGLPLFALRVNGARR